MTGGTDSLYPLGYKVVGHEGLPSQLRVIANKINFGFYGREAGATKFNLQDGTQITYAADVNLGTTAVMTALGADTSGSYDTWQQDIGEFGLMLTYRHLFGDPFANYQELFPDSLHQPWLCLLYTSPSPRDLSTSRMPSSA